MPPSALVILDGFGYREDSYCNAIAQAHTPTLDYLWRQYPHALLAASGTSVGLPEGYIGNSQIGHRTIGAGRVIEQPINIINKAIGQNGFRSKQLLILLKKLQESGRTLHILGLLSDAGVHSHINHLAAFLKNAGHYHITKVIVHLFLDGRDVPPKSAMIYIQQLNTILKTSIPVCIGSIVGRFYAMDRDENWERTQQSYSLLTQAEGYPVFNSIKEAIDHYYKDHITDEFIPPTRFSCFQPIRSEDGIIFFNFRPDRACQLISALVDHDFNHFPTTPINPQFCITPFSYAPHIKTDALFRLPKIEHTLKEILIDSGKTIFSIAETEKYAHVTYFFAGGNHNLGIAQTNLLIPSLKSKNYSHHPCMKASQITETVIKSLYHHPFDFYVVNYANADMVGHSGNLTTTIQAIECLNKEIQKLYEEFVLIHNGTIYLTADHGNAEDMTPEWATSHTTNPVPFIMIQKNIQKIPQSLPLNSLSDIAPFILKQLSITLPQEMKK